MQVKEKTKMNFQEAVEVIKGELAEQSPEVLSEFDGMLDQAKSQGEIAKIILQVLRKKGWTIEKLIEKFVDLAENAITADAKGNIIPNDYVKLQALTKLAEMAGLYKQKNIEIKTNFLQVLYSDKED